MYILLNWLKFRIKKILPPFILKGYYLFFPFFGNLIFKFPSEKIPLIGITGTDGKSSTVLITKEVLKKAGYKVGFTSSVLFGDGNKEYTNERKVTMPGRFFLQKFIKELVDNGCNFGIIEVTSEGIKQERCRLINFDIVVFTNITPEHIESHGGFEKYKEAKYQIFRNLYKNRKKKKDVSKIIIINNDCFICQSVLEYSADLKITFGFNQKADIQGKLLKSTFEKNEIFIRSSQEEITIQSRLGGPFIAENILASAAIVQALKIPLNLFKNAVEKINDIPGRFEIISKKPFIIVDYAHTVAAVRKLLKFCRMNWRGEIIHIFGAAGEIRDKWKRPVLGQLSEFYTDFTILTEENPFEEPNEKILNEIKMGIQDQKRVLIIPSRKEAIQKGISLMKENSLLLITGKGCEEVIVGPFGKRTPHNDKKVVLSILNSFKK